MTIEVIPGVGHLDDSGAEIDIVPGQGILDERTSSEVVVMTGLFILLPVPW